MTKKLTLDFFSCIENKKQKLVLKEKKKNNQFSPIPKASASFGTKRNDFKAPLVRKFRVIVLSTPLLPLLL